MIIKHSTWTSTELDHRLRIERTYEFRDEASAAGFIREVGQFMSSPNISVLLEKLPGQPSVVASIQTARDEFLLESVQIFSLELDHFYEEQSAVPVEVPA